jgi:NTP pyrophosphatase (non-canonical NTP hydrolase)
MMGELGELCEIFQWAGDDARKTVSHFFQEKPEVRDHLAQELADVSIYFLRFANLCEVEFKAAAEKEEEKKKNDKKTLIDEDAGNTNNGAGSIISNSQESSSSSSSSISSAKRRKLRKTDFVQKKKRSGSNI